MSREDLMIPNLEHPVSAEALFSDASESLGLQSYEYFEGNGAHRTAEKQAFLAGEIENPDFDYPLLDVAEIDKHQRVLAAALEASLHLTDDNDVQTAYWAAVGYRLAEVYFLKEAIRLNNDDDTTDQRLSANRFMDLGAEIYGSPEKPIFDAAVAEIWRQIDDKDLDSVGEAIKSELETMLPRPVEAGVIPSLSQEAFEFYGQEIDRYFSDEKDIVEKHWQRIIERDGDDTAGFTPDDILMIFEEVNTLYDGEAYDIKVEKYDGRAIAFSIKDRVLKIGDKHVNMKTANSMLAKVVHEYGIHVGRFINGLNSGVYISATGHYDYLDFEEGLATVFEQIIKRKTEKLSPANIGHYVHLGLAQGLSDGIERDFRQVFEIAWRYRLLMNIKNSETITQEKIDETKAKTYDFTIKRIFRGTPSDLPGVVFTKDLAYLRGRVKATEYLEANLGDQDAFMQLFAAKYDPTNELHSKVVNSMKGQE